MELCANLPGSCSIQQLCCCLWARMSMCAGNMGNMSTCTVLLFEVGQLRGTVVVDVGVSNRSGKKGQSRRQKKKKWKETRVEEEALVMERSGGGKVSKRRGNSAWALKPWTQQVSSCRAYGRMSEDALKSSSSDRSVLFWFASEFLFLLCRRRLNKECTCVRGTNHVTRVHC